MRRVAVYGKGGIGKSTISANLSVALSRAGRRVLQVGCDPKHDSTRLLLGGRQLTCVLDYLREARPQEYNLSAVLEEGFAGVGCVEAGGPKPGVGCAGRGIISTFDLLEQFRLDERYDTVIYDVLGDVVCGGFAVPIRREYADTVLVVTSGEFMSLYAANNILRGIRNYDGDSLRRVAGIVCNSRDVVGEDERVKRFAEAVKLPVFARVPRSDSFAQAERAHMTVMQQGVDEALCALFEDMAARLLAADELYAACPLEDDELEEAVLGTGQRAGAGQRVEEARMVGEAAVNTRSQAYSGSSYGSSSADSTPADSKTPDAAAPSGTRTFENGSGDAGSSAQAPDSDSPSASQASEATSATPEIEDLQDFWDGPSLTDPNRYLSKTLVSGEPLHGCAFNGAIATALNVADAVVVAHSPSSCANLSYAAFTSTGRRRLFERGTLLPVSLAPNLVCTNMDEPQIVFGGTDELLRCVERVKRQGARAIVVISSCPAGIIGDDLDSVADLSDETCAVVPLKTDGNMSGDFLQGQLAAHLAIARTLFDRDAPPRPRTVNVFGEKMVVTNTQANFEVVSGYLERMGVSVNCRFLNAATVDELRGFCSAELNLPAYGDYTARLLGQLIREEFGGETFDRPFPIGFDETAAWLRELGARFDCPHVAEELIASEARRYEEAIAQLKPSLAGKKLMVVTFNCELDWILKTAIDLEMEVVRIGILNYSQDTGFRTRLDVDFPVIENYDRFGRAGEIERLAPDVLLTNYASSAGDDVPVADTIPMCPDVGFFSSIALARRWVRLMRLRLKGGWRDDAQLF